MSVIVASLTSDRLGAIFSDVAQAQAPQAVEHRLDRSVGWAVLRQWARDSRA